MDTPDPGHYWKTPFIWEPGMREPPPPRLRFEPAEPAWLREAIATTMSNSLDESDRATVAQLGAERAVDDLFDIAKQWFVEQPGWWQVALDAQGQRVGYVLTTTFADPARNKDGKPQGTILYMGVLPQHRGHGHALELVHQATRLCIGANCWRVFCDTGSLNQPMVNAFRQAGWQERKPWQRPLV
jgi:GNAT superfamily N-acetyltransferase